MGSQFNWAAPYERLDQWVREQMTNTLESNTSSTSQSSAPSPSGWFKVAAIAAASALAGGLAAAWWYRNTLKTLRQEGENPSNPHFGIPEDESSDQP